jgi:hypothetical protein
MAQNPDDKTPRGHSRRDALMLAGAASVAGAGGLAQAQSVSTPAPVREALAWRTAQYLSENWKTRAG